MAWGSSSKTNNHNLLFLEEPGGQGNLQGPIGNVHDIRKIGDAESPRVPEMGVVWRRGRQNRRPSWSQEPRLPHVKLGHLHPAVPRNDPQGHRIHPHRVVVAPPLSSRVYWNTRKSGHGDTQI